MAKAATKVQAANPVAMIETLAKALDKNEALATKMEAIADADDTRAMSSVDILRLLTDTDNGGLTEDQLNELPDPGTQGWIKPIYDATGEKLLNDPTDEGKYPLGYANNPEYLRRQSDRQGSTQLVPYSRLELFASNLAVCRGWADKISEAQAMLDSHTITQDDFDIAQRRWQGRIDRMSVRVVNALRLGKQMANAQQPPWDTKLEVVFAQEKRFERDKEGKFKKDKNGNPIFTWVDIATDKPIHMFSLAEDGKTRVNRFEKTVEQFLALDFVWAAQNDGKETPAGELQTLWETVERAPKAGKDTINVTNSAQGISSFVSLAAWLPGGGDDAMQEALRRSKSVAEELAAIRTVRNHCNGWLNLANNKAILAKYDEEQIAAEEKAKAEKAGAAKVA